MNSLCSIKPSVFCGICGDDHKYSECSVLEIKQHIKDAVIPSRARLTLPSCFDLVMMADGSSCIVANAFIEKGTQFGPLEAQKLLTMNPEVQFVIKLFSFDVEDLSEYYLDTCDENSCNWMMFITAAQNEDEQNLICFQEKTKIFYVANKDIQEGEYVKLWYSPYYAKRMGADILKPVTEYEAFTKLIDINGILKKQQNIVDRENWNCKFCGKLETDVTLFASHMIEHYNGRSIKKKCDICKETFTNKIHLKKHQRIDHSAVFGVTRKQRSEVVQSVKNTSKDRGDPLLNNLPNDTFDNSNLVLPNLELNQFTINLGNNIANQSALLEPDNLTLNVENLLIGNVTDSFNFEIGESQEQHVCDICLKSFSKVNNLKAHMRMHTGKFTCRDCLKIFSRKENLKSHVCNNFKEVQFRCSICKRGFALKKYLQRHIRACHEKKYACENCGKVYYSTKEYKDHNCSAGLQTNIDMYVCEMCNKGFSDEKRFKKHLTTHSNKATSTKERQRLICEICAQEFTTIQGLKLHSHVHTQRKLDCKICHKTFLRPDVLRIHTESVHEIINKFECAICKKEFKLKRYLTLHMLQHSEVKSHTCNVCFKSFHLASSLHKHKENVHSKKCNVCKNNFESDTLLAEHKKSHAIEYFECPLCNRFLKLRSSLRRHLKSLHSDQDVEGIMSQVKSKEIIGMNYDENMVDEGGIENEDSGVNNEINANLENDNFESMVNNFDDIMDDYDCDDTECLLSEKCTIMEKSNPNVERILDFNDLEIDFTNNLNIPNTNENREVCLSMPDLTESDQEITLGENAYMLEDGTIVEPKEPGNVLMYVLGKDNVT